MIVVDTNVVSELMRPQPDESVMRWALTQAPSTLYTTSITVAEILYGIERLPAGQRQDGLRTAATDVFANFADRVLPFDASAAEHYPSVVGSRERLGIPIHGFDAQIASICRGTGATLATRNTKDFERTEIELIDPWCGKASGSFAPPGS